MADIVSKDQRSEIMRAVKSTGNRSTEVRLIELFRKRHITGWRRNYRLYGSPDFVFPRLRLAVFADGCFWHGHECRNTKPAANAKYWDRKIRRNIDRDREVTQELTRRNWRIVRIWECEIRQGAAEKLRIIQECKDDDAGPHGNAKV